MLNKQPQDFFVSLISLNKSAVSPLIVLSNLITHNCFYPSKICFCSRFIGHLATQLTFDLNSLRSLFAHLRMAIWDKLVWYLCKSFRKKYFWRVIPCYLNSSPSNYHKHPLTLTVNIFFITFIHNVFWCLVGSSLDLPDLSLQHRLYIFWMYVLPLSKCASVLWKNDLYTSSPIYQYTAGWICNLEIEIYNVRCVFVIDNLLVTEQHKKSE